MKVHERKKAYRRMIKDLAMKHDKINAPNGLMINRSSAADNSMRRDYYPNRGGL